MKYEQATQIIQHHLEWLRSDKSIEYKYTEEAFNEALTVLLNPWISVEDDLPKYGTTVLVMGEKMGASPAMGGAYLCLSKRVDLTSIKVHKGMRQPYSEKGFHFMKYVTKWKPIIKP